MLKNALFSGLAFALFAVPPALFAKGTNQMKMTVGTQTFEIVLEQNETARAFSGMLPLTVEMDDLNGNEKYVYLDRTLPTEAEYVGNISAGDVMLFGDNCLVVFYKSFHTSYSYTRIGRITDGSTPDALSGGMAVTAFFSNGD